MKYFIFILSTFLSFSQLAYAQEPVAQVVWVKGSVQAVRPSGIARVLERRSGVYVNDTLRTEAGSSGQIVFTDKTMLALQGSTQLKIEDYVFRKGATRPSDEKQVLSLIQGGFRTITGIIAKENPGGYEAKTPVATIGVRGTDYRALFLASSGLITAVYQGRIIVTNDSGSYTLNPETSKFARIVSSTSAPRTQMQPPPELQGTPSITGAGTISESTRPVKSLGPCPK